MNRDPNVITELRRIAEEHDGILNPAIVVQEASAVSSPLHSHFEWDDGVAAQQHRIAQARGLIRVSVELVGSGDSAKLVRAFVSLTPDRRPSVGYRALGVVLNDAQHRRQLLSDALAELQSFERKYRGLQELAGIFAEVRKVKAPRGRGTQSAKGRREAVA